ncbi:MAG: hypothetical protein H6Q14_2281 [Bacteroidetes bacterium]|jgi:periplasmic protein CpxP/Spy|nr:hypothetical protein [Bacteroidota bacterium]
MKKLILSAIAALMICGLQAQDARPQKARQEFTPEKIAQFETERVTKDLKLDKETKQKISEINLRFAKEQVALRQANNAKREELRKQMEAIRSEKDKAYEKVLSPKDFAIYKQKREEARKKMQERRANGENNDADSGAGRDRGSDSPTRD